MKNITHDITSSIVAKAIRENFTGQDPFDGLNSKLFDVFPKLKKGLFGRDLPAIMGMKMDEDLAFYTGRLMSGLLIITTTACLWLASRLLPAVPSCLLYDFKFALFVMFLFRPDKGTPVCSYFPVKYRL